MGRVRLTRSILRAWAFLKNSITFTLGLPFKAGDLLLVFKEAVYGICGGSVVSASD